MKRISKLFGLGIALLGMLTACGGETQNASSEASVNASSETSVAPSSSAAPVSSTDGGSSVGHTHDYGELVPEVLPSYFYDGRKAHYHCSGCGKYFDTNKQEVTLESLKLERAGDSIAISVNNVQKGLLNQTTKTESSATWNLNNIAVNKNDVISLTKPGDVTYKYAFFGNGNIDDNNKILTAGNVNFNLAATPNGLMLDVSGYKYERIVVKVDDTEYPMNQVTYFESDKQTYIYGYHNFAAGDKMVVIDNINNKTYNYNDIEDDTKWNTYDFHKNANNEFVFDKAGRYGIEFDRGGDKKISVTKTFGPNTGSSFQVAFSSERAAITMQKTSFATTSEEYKEATWYLNHEKVINADDIQQAVANGLDLYMSSVTFDANEKFNIKNVAANKTINSDHLVSFSGANESIALDGDYVKILKAGSYEVCYLPCQDAIAIYTSLTPSGDAYLMIGGDFNPLTKDANNVVSYQGHFNKNAYCAFVDNGYNPITPTLDNSVDASLVRISSYLVYFNKAGTFKLELNLTTSVLKVTAIELDPDDTPTELTGARLVGKGGLSGVLTTNPDNSAELCIKNIAITGTSESFYVTFYKEDFSGAIEGITLSEESKQYATSYSTLFYITSDGTYDFFLNKSTLVLRIVKHS